LFCTQPFNHIDIIVENDKVMLQPCNVWNIKKFGLEEYKNNVEDLKAILANSYHHPGCEICYNEDKKNIRSRRVAQNQFAEDNNLSLKKLQSLGVRYGTLCNSKCMICSHHRSSSWVADAEKLGIKVEEKYRYKKNLLPGVDIFFDNFDLDDLRYVEFHGGEPLMQEYPAEFLEKIKKPEQLIVKFNTNLTVLPSKKLERILKRQKRVDMLISVDDIESRYEMLRYPGKWEKFIENLKSIKEKNYKLIAYNTISSLNVFYMIEFYTWAVKNFGSQVHSQFVTDKDFLDISYLPIHAKEKVLLKISKHKGSLFDSIREKLNVANEDCSQKLFEYILKLDKIRKTNFAETFVEWWKILNDK
jgi:hypothetical protein